MRIKILLILFSSLFCRVGLSAQCMLDEISLNARIDQSIHIVEGKIIAQRAFWEDNKSNIFTANKIEIYKSFKGALLMDYVELLTRGGFVGTAGQTDNPSLQLKEGETGIFFLIENQENITLSRVPDLEVYQPATGPQGFIKYNKKNGTANDPFSIYEQIVPDLYEVIEKALKKKYVEVNNFNLNQWVNRPNQTKKMSFTFTPATVTAGTDAVLTISDPGGGLGSMGVVRFSNADNGGATIDVEALVAEHCTWSTTEIKVQVPSKASTGNFEVVPSGESAIVSTTALTVTYAQLNAISSFVPPLNSYQTQHYNNDGSGGYTWQRFTDFANGPGAPPFLRAVETWCNTTNIYWTIGSNTTVDVVAKDGTNIVRFDNGSELPGGVLGRNTSYWSGCTTGSTKDCETGVGTPALQWYVSELDIAFDDGASWNYGPGATTGSDFDFESVAFHELGHGHQLGHVNDSGAAMHFSISNASDKRSPNANETAGAADVYNRSTTSAVCAVGLMATNINCSALLLPVELVNFTAQKQSRSVSINWTTASEINNDYFLLQRSVNGALFQDLTRITGAGFSNEILEYSFIDDQPLAGVNYYRLKQVDYDGKFEYSDVRAVNFEVAGEEIVVYPNPLEGTDFNIVFSFPTDTDMKIELIDSRGSILFHEEELLWKGISKVWVSTEEYLPGVYWLRFTFRGKVRIERIVKI